ncbi:MAG: lysylphosphatidylglycerol synthase transmembrane domain-containing protein [Bacteriovorax sp.]
MIKLSLKFLFAAALLYWLFMSGKLDLSLVKKSFEVGPQWLIAFALIALQMWLGAFRYKLLLETKSQKKIPYLKLVRINYIGQFFSTLLPGAVTGDFFKLVYVKNLNDKFSKTFLVTTTLLDRVIGLSGLLFLAGFFSLIYYSEITALSSQIASVIFLNLFLFAGTLVFLGILVAPFHLQEKILILCKKIPFIGNRIFEILDQLFSLRESRLDILYSFLISVVSQFLSILSFWIISSPFYSGHLPLQYAFSFIPVGLIATVIPISPGGLGVGHVLFANLFSFVNINNGASLFNLFFLCNFAHNLLGLIPYLLSDKINENAELK